MTDKRQKPWVWRKAPNEKDERGFFFFKEGFKWNEGGRDDIQKMSIYSTGIVNREENGV